MPLEPTEEQWREIRDCIQENASAAVGPVASKAVFALVRDIVLKEVEKEAVRLAFEAAPEKREGSSLRVGGDRYFFVSGLSQLRTWLLKSRGERT